MKVKISTTEIYPVLILKETTESGKTIINLDDKLVLEFREARESFLKIQQEVIEAMTKQDLYLDEI